LIAELLSRGISAAAEIGEIIEARAGELRLY